jgi:putative transposase
MATMLTVLRRQRPGQLQLSSLDRLLWVLLYRIWPQVIDTMILVKPATVIAWHRKVCVPKIRFG